MCKAFSLSKECIIWYGNVIINDKLAMARSYVNILRSIRDRARTVDDLDRDLALRGAVESLINVSMRLCSIINLNKPERYRDVARILANANVLSNELVDCSSCGLALGMCLTTAMP